MCARVCVCVMWVLCVYVCCVCVLGTLWVCAHTCTPVCLCGVGVGADWQTGLQVRKAGSLKRQDVTCVQPGGPGGAWGAEGGKQRSSRHLDYSQARGMTEKGTYFKVLIEIT